MGATVMSANLKIKFDVFIEIRGRSTATRRDARPCLRSAYISVILHVGGSRGDFNSAVTNDGS